MRNIHWRKEFRIYNIKNKTNFAIVSNQEKWIMQSEGYDLANISQCPHLSEFQDDSDSLKQFQIGKHKFLSLFLKRMLTEEQIEARKTSILPILIPVYKKVDLL